MQQSRQLAEFLLRAPPLRVPYFGYQGTQFVLAALTLVATAALLGLRRGDPRTLRIIGHLLVANVALQLLVWAYDVYLRAADASGRITVVQALFILFALLWEVLLSGETMTNVDGRRFPRHGRVMIFFGYLVIVAAAVLYGSSLMTHSGTTAQAQFDSDGWTEYGMLLLGIPLILVHAMLNITRDLMPSRAREQDPPPVAPEPASA